LREQKEILPLDSTKMLFSWEASEGSRLKGVLRRYEQVLRDNEEVKNQMETKYDSTGSSWLHYADTSEIESGNLLLDELDDEVNFLLN